MTNLCYRQLLSYFTTSAKPKWLGVFYAMLLSLSVFCQIIFMRAYFHNQFILGLRFRSAVTGLVYRKVRLSSLARPSHSSFLLLS